MVSGQDGPMAGKDHDEPVPEADAIEQARAIQEDPDDLPGSVRGLSGADAVDRARPVVDDHAVRSPSDRGEVPEADWLEQSIVEPLDDEVR